MMAGDVSRRRLSPQSSTSLRIAASPISKADCPSLKNSDFELVGGVTAAVGSPLGKPNGTPPLSCSASCSRTRVKNRSFALFQAACAVHAVQSNGKLSFSNCRISDEGISGTFDIIYPQ